MAGSDADSERQLAAVLQSGMVCVFPSQYGSAASAAEGLGVAMAELQLEGKDTFKGGDVEVEGGGNVGRGGSASEEEGKEREDNKTGGEKVKRGKDLYPQRPGEPDCAYYIRTGKCAFGKNCKFNHPSEQGKVQVQYLNSQDMTQNLEESAKENKEEDNKEELAIKVGKLKCKYYGTPGGCKYGDACRYSHCKDKSETGTVELNFLGLPVRPAEKECQFYMRTGSCKFSASCRYHHPDPTATGGSDPPSGFSTSSSSLPNLVPASWHHQIAKDGSFLFADSSLSYVHQMPTTQLHTNRVWHVRQAPPDPFLDMKSKRNHIQFLHHDAATTNGNENQPPVTPSPSTFNDSSDGSKSKPVEVVDLPHRPGQPECPYYLKKGGCKYRSCKFHHPANHLQNPSACVVSPSGLPLRPGKSICTHYSRYGICKLGPACSFDHPSHIPQNLAL